MRDNTVTLLVVEGEVLPMFITCTCLLLCLETEKSFSSPWADKHSSFIRRRNCNSQQWHTITQHTPHSHWHWHCTMDSIFLSIHISCQYNLSLFLYWKIDILLCVWNKDKSTSFLATVITNLFSAIPYIGENNIE